MLTEMQSTLGPSRDQDALDALNWIDGGMPDIKVHYGPDAPKLTPEQLQQFKPACYVHKNGRVSLRKRAKTPPK